MAADVILLALMVSGFLFILVVLGIMADSWDARERRRDAYRRNHVRRVK